ncbi:MAG: helix-turn-helix domain-containing protein [Eubacteriales bacterium]|nr:helix-turn-helix domain-containing protein [Eubacteriales bacterium]
MTTNSTKTSERSIKDGRISLSTRIWLTYSVFLLLCLVLAIVLYSSTTQNAREMYWQQEMTQHESHVQAIDSYLRIMDNYTRQLLNDSTFIRFSNMKSVREKGAMYAAYQTMETLSSRIFSWAGMPVAENHIYLKRMGYVISASQFTEARQYYLKYRVFAPERYEGFISMLQTASGMGENIDVSSFTGKAGSYFYVRDIDSILNRNVPAVIWFEWDVDSLSQLFALEKDYRLTVVDGLGRLQLQIPFEGDDELSVSELEALPYDSLGIAHVGELVCLRDESSFNDWTYYSMIPQRLCDESLGNYDLLFVAMLLLATLSGLAMVTVMVRRNMRPIVQLNDQLVEANRSNEQMAQDLERQKPLVCRSYTRMLLSGHVASEREFQFMMNALGYDQPKLRFYAMFLTVFNQEETVLDRKDFHEIMSTAIDRHFTGDLPVYYYSTLVQEYVVLTAFKPDVQDPLMQLQQWVLNLHNDLAQRYSLWLCAGVGGEATQPMNVWESYEQARASVRYTSKRHVFIPYEMIHKDSQTIYYPIEISAKLLHFITTGNSPQVSEMFALIHRENIEQRSLPDPLLEFLLSDLKNTLLKARFSVSAPTETQKERLSQVDEKLSGRPNLALLENVGLMLCDFFRETAEPSDPIPEVQQYLKEHFTDSAMCLSLLSERFHISESYLSHLFKERTGCNFSVYLEDLRLNEAARRLQADQDCSLQSLFEDVGYNNATSFRRAFKKKFGITPSAMRETPK